MYVRIAAVFFTLISCAWPQREVEVGSKPSPMEAFAARSGARTSWSSRIATLERGGSRVTLTALVIEDSSGQVQTVRGVKVDLASAEAEDHIYLDEEAAARTRSSLEEILEMVQRRGGTVPNGCYGAKAFWPLYDWSWNAYHELNADYCGWDGGTLVLSGRGSHRAFRLPGVDPSVVVNWLADAIAQLKLH